MSSQDPRRKVGERVFAKACHVTSLAECAHRYGARAKSKEVPGVVIEVMTAKTKNNRTNTYVLAEYSFGGGVTKRVKLNIRSVLKEVSVPQDAVDDD